MSLSPIIKQQLDDLVKIPTVTVTKDNIPYECKESGSSQRFRSRRFFGPSQGLPFELYQYVLENDVSMVKVMEFSSGVFMNYVDSHSIYS